jgi:RsiW-degrading membrane proteinase PrsW (M82 family)
MRSGNTEFYKKAKSSSLTLKDVFSDVFKKHSIKDGERVFIAGTSLSTPSPENMLLEWRKPWLFVRVLFIGFFVLFLLKVMIVQGFGIYAIAPYVFFAASVMPVAILLFYWEMNIPRNIPIYEVMMMFIVGGIISLILTGYLNTIIVTSQDCWAPVTEEPAKLLASLVFLRKKKKNFILNGILIGGAIGAGFAAIETAGYIIRFGEDTGLDRGLMAPGGHVAWAAMYVGALAKVMGSDEFKFEHLVNGFFLKFFFSACILHFLWNLEICLIPLPYFGDISYILLTIAAWLLLLQIFRYGIQEVLSITSTGIGNSTIVNGESRCVSADSAKLIGISGIFNEQSIHISKETIVLGRDASICNLVFPENAKGISKKHCSITYDGSRITVRDEGSTYGTFLDNGQKLRVGEAVPLYPGQRFYLANQNNMFEVKY